MDTKELAAAVEKGHSGFALLYGPQETEKRERCHRAAGQFERLFGNLAGTRLLSVPGRSEVCGNHTDHNRGRVLACAVDLDIIAVAAPSGDGTVVIQSEGFEPDTVRLEELGRRTDEKGRASALIRGVCARLKELGYRVEGFRAYTTSSVLKGSGLSSSAAFEVMTANIISTLFNGGGIDPVEMAKVGQYAESVYFGKPCGLMDQTACAVGGFVAIDFRDPAAPVLDRIDFDFAGAGHALCIVDTRGDHADLSDDYAAIRAEMTAVAGGLGHGHLRACSPEAFYARIPELRAKLGDRAVLRAIHFFEDDARVPLEAAALRAGDFDAFLRLVNASGRSSYMYLQNIYSIKTPQRQGLALALALAERQLRGHGAFRVHGGGFAGTIQAFVPRELYPAFSREMDRVFGADACYSLSVRPVGAYAFDFG